MWTDQTIRQDDLGDGHSEASDQYLNELKHHRRRRSLKDKVLIGEWERRKRCPEPCERHDPLVEDGREPSLPSEQRKKSQCGERRRGTESRVWLARRAGVLHTVSSLLSAIAMPRPARSSS